MQKCYHVLTVVKNLGGGDCPVDLDEMLVITADKAKARDGIMKTRS